MAMVLAIPVVCNQHLLVRGMPARLAIFKLEPFQTSLLLKVVLDEHGTWMYKIEQDMVHIHAISVSNTVIELAIVNLYLLARALHARWGIRQLHPVQPCWLVFLGGTHVQCTDNSV